jgi:hypothetical protein
MIWAFLSSRVRTWLLFALVLPLGGRLLHVLGVRVSERNPRAGQAMTSTGSRMQDLRGRRRRR